MKFVLIISAFLLFIKSGSCLKCYECSSLYNDRCTNEKVSKAFSKECPVGSKLCLKVLMSSKSNSDILVSRMCVKPHIKDPCETARVGITKATELKLVDCKTCSKGSCNV